LGAYFTQLFYLSSLLTVPVTRVPPSSQAEVFSIYHTFELVLPCSGSTPRYVTTLCPLPSSFFELISPGVYSYDNDLVYCVSSDELVIRDPLPLCSPPLPPPSSLSPSPLSPLSPPPARRPLLVVRSMGRLGNELFQFFTSMGVAERFDLELCIPSTDFKSMQSLFLMDEFLSDECPPAEELAPLETECCYATHMPSYGSLSAADRSLDYAANGYRQSFKNFDQIDVLPHLSPRPEVAADTFDFFQQFVEPFDRGTRVTVGMHVRRGDHLALGYMKFPGPQVRRKCRLRKGGSQTFSSLTL